MKTQRNTSLRRSRRRWANYVSHLKENAREYGPDKSGSMQDQMNGCSNQGKEICVFHENGKYLGDVRHCYLLCFLQL
jgi:hypothetical protein